MRNLPIIFTMLVGLFLVSCQEETNSDLEALKALEAAIESDTPTEAQIEELSAKYMAYAEKHPEDHDSNSKHLQTLARIQFEQGRFSGAVKLLKEALRDHYVAERAAAQMQFMATIYKDHMNNPVVGNSAYWAFTEAFSDHSMKQKIQDSLLVNYPGIPSTLDSLRAQLYDEENARIDYSKANQFIDVSEVYALAMPDNPESAGMIAEAAKVAGYVNAHGRALDLYNWVYTRYPDHPKAGQSLFMMGFIHDNEEEYRDKDKAKELYEKFIANYPEDDFADDATFLLQNLNKSDEEILNAFEGEGE
ncbi:MAG: tetratricopeptide repeat protein [Bacteroidetes bacterium]|nr:tetratricopeptide repeat protein [Bacteroidota bacterium]